MPIEFFGVFKKTEIKSRILQDKLYLKEITKLNRWERGKLQTTDEEVYLQPRRYANLDAPNHASTEFAFFVLEDFPLIKRRDPEINTFAELRHTSLSDTQNLNLTAGSLARILQI
ncbi:hypothetical protein TcasGA2_TC000400 [Tribolium castaneum]|uniref:Uncharacterized protein n=1 Tax=Tribolium castaneum TaxID=7070 RepID=D6WAG6_TRICA|nr:hypothetical protein TcasGA2_TC000400 [Tribolium castaneum]